ETAARATVGGFMGWAWSAVSGEVGWRVAGGRVMQVLETGGGYAGWVAGTGPWVGAGFRLGPRTTLSVGGGADGIFLRGDQGIRFLAAPHVEAGVSLGL